MADSLVPTLLPQHPELRMLPAPGCPPASLLTALSEQGKRASSLFWHLFQWLFMPLVVFGLCQVFFPPISMTDASRIFPGHIRLAASSHCWQSSSLHGVLKFGNLLGYFYVPSTPF